MVKALGKQNTPVSQLFINKREHLLVECHCHDRLTLLLDKKPWL
jgi:hypothetical protein